MASRKEQKEKLRREREEREAAAKAAEQRKRMVGYGVGGGIVALVAIVLIVLLVAGGGSSDSSSPSSDVLPGGGSIPDQKVTDLNAAAKAAGCELKSVKAKSREHTGDLSEKIKYSTNPPTSGKHYQVPAEDKAYSTAPDEKELVHAMEHGRVIIWFKKTLPKDDRANLKALYDDDSYQMILTPDNTGMTYAVAATAWNAQPTPLGTGQLLGCPKFTPGVYDAIRAFKDENRSNGPEAVP
jgi:hypothetical protein